MHSIQVAITKENEKLTKELTKKRFLFRNINGWTVIAAKKGIRPTIAQFNTTCVFAMTDYFGGIGHQVARLINLKDRTEKRFKKINDGLIQMGVKKPDEFKYDHYEFLGLSDIRENYDLKKYC